MTTINPGAYVLIVNDKATGFNGRYGMLMQDCDELGCLVRMCNGSQVGGSFIFRRDEIRALTIEGYLSVEPDNYAYMCGVLEGVLNNIRTYVNATSRRGKRITAREIRCYLDRAAELEAIREAAWKAKHDATTNNNNG